MRKIFFIMSFLLFVSAVSQQTIYSKSTPKRQTYHIFLDPKEQTKLSARVSSPIKKIFKRMGDAFVKDEPLIFLDDQVFLAINLKAEANVIRAETELASKEALFKDNAASLFELKEAQYNVANTKSELATAQEALSGTKILAPYNGKVSNLYFEERELPKVDDILIEVLNDEILLARFLVDSKLNVQLGQPIRIDVLETGDTIDAKITRMSPDIDPSSGTIKVEAEIDNKEGRWKAGMSGEAYFIQEST